MSEDKTLIIATEFVTVSLLEMVRICSADPKIFSILQQYGLQLRHDIDANTHYDISNNHKDAFKAAWELFEDIVEST